MNPHTIKIGRHLTLTEFCTCTQTYRAHADHINPYPANPDASIAALQALGETLLDPIIDHYGRDRFQLTYGFCSTDLKKFLHRTNPETGRKNGRIDPSRDQHMAHERNQRGRYWCDRLGAACDFRILDVASDRVIDWILAAQLPFDSLYFYGCDRPLHLSHGPQQKRAIWAFTPQNTPTRKNLDPWLRLAREIP